MSDDFAKFSQILRENGQAHVLRFYKELNAEEKQSLMAQVKSINFAKFNSEFKVAMKTVERPSKIVPVPISRFGSALRCGQVELKKYWKAGLEAISENKVAALVLCGGQGTRLGVSIPKGMLPLGLPSGKTILQIFCERIQRLRTLCSNINCSLPFYILTSDATHEEINAYLVENDHFGLPESDFSLFKQEMSPCYQEDGKILLASKFEISMAPNGTGGLFSAMAKHGLVADMENRGIEYVHMFPIDNVLIKVADPIFIGYCVETRTDCAAKVVRKFKPEQNVGTICHIDGRFGILEYSEISTEDANLRNENGELAFQSGSTCIHLFTRNFIAEMANVNLRPHVARKKMKSVDETGQIVTPQKPNAIKIERFVFESFPYACNFVTWEVGYDEFSPVKNANSAKYECQLTARYDLLSLHRKFVKLAGGHVDETAEIEVSPLLSYCGENLGKRVRNVKFPKNSTTHLMEEKEHGKSVGVDCTFQAFSQLFEIHPAVITE